MEGRWVERERRWEKRFGDYVTRFQGAFTTPSGAIRRCGHWHETHERANACGSLLQRKVWTDAGRG